MANTQLRFLLLCVCILSPLTTKGVHGQCSTPPRNLAVYEGTQNTMMTCDSPTKVSWIFRPTTDELDTYEITNYSDTVAPAYTNLFDVNQKGLTIKTAQGNATAGFYITNFPNSRTGAKLLVVRQPPMCNCKAIDSTNNQLSCSLTYGDNAVHPINAKMAWTSSGHSYKEDIPQRRRVDPYFVSTSSITVKASDKATYECKVTLAKPTDIQYDFLAKNAPEFAASCTIPLCGKPNE